MKNLILDILQYLAITGFLTLIYWCISGLIHVAFYQFKLWDKCKVTFKKKINPKYLVKVNPIYKMEQSELSNSMYVRKYELGWDTRENVQFFLSLIPYPIEILYYEYQSGLAYHTCDREDVVEFSKKYTLEEFYEEKQRESDIEDMERLQRKNTIENLNKTFNENYE